MKQRIDELFPGCSFRLDGVCYTIKSIEPGKVWCDSEDGTVVVFHGWEEPDRFEGRTFRMWFSYQLKAIIP